MTQHGGQLFLLGLAAGLALLTASSYRRVSPPWLRRLLFAVGAFVAFRYVAVALFAQAANPHDVWVWRHAWFATAVGLTLPSVVAVDQLLRHPAMTPAKLLTWYSPFLAAYAAIILYGGYVAAPEASGGWTLHLTPEWRTLLIVTQAVFVLGFIGIAGFVIMKFPLPRVRAALAGLIAAHLGLSTHRLPAELFALLALWYAFETAAELQRAA